MKTPKVPKVEKPKKPIQADSVRDEGKAQTQNAQPPGLASFISAGRLQKRARTRKASLLGE